MHLFYSPRYHIDLGDHVYPTAKYHLVCAGLLRQRLAGPDDFVEPAPAAWVDLALVHTDEYLGKIREGRLSEEEIFDLELPWSVELVEGFRLMTGGTIEATRALFRAPRRGVAVHIGGGFHHAFGNHGEGFCLFNDVAVAIRVLQRDHLVSRAAVIDCDVHHGNGTAFIFQSDPSVFTFSMHQQHIYPMFKPRSSLDIGLDNGTADAEYLRALEAALPRVLQSRPEVIFYLAGADPYQDDRLGGLALTFGGLRARDSLVVRAARAAQIPLVITLAGGYARHVEDTVSIHLATIDEARSQLIASRAEPGRRARSEDPSVREC